MTDTRDAGFGVKPYASPERRREAADHRNPEMTAILSDTPITLQVLNGGSLRESVFFHSERRDHAQPMGTTPRTVDGVETVTGVVKDVRTYLGTDVIVFHPHVGDDERLSDTFAYEIGAHRIRSGDVSVEFELGNPDDQAEIDAFLALQTPVSELD